MLEYVQIGTRNLEYNLLYTSECSPMLAVQIVEKDESRPSMEVHGYHIHECNFRTNIHSDRKTYHFLEVSYLDDR